jgi:hypothetical protein
LIEKLSNLASSARICSQRPDLQSSPLIFNDKIKRSVSQFT